MFKAVLFDFDGTLVDFVEADIACLGEINRLVSSGVPEELFVEKAVGNIMKFHDLASAGLVDLLTLHSYRLSKTFSDLGIPWDKKYVQVYRSALIERSVPYPGVRELLSFLRGRVKLGMLTNAYDPVMQTGRIRAAGLYEFFDSIVITGEEAFSKPDPRAFLLPCARLDVKPEECIFVGNSPEYDVQGAKGAGMHAVLLQGVPASNLCSQDDHVRSIGELTDLLKKLIQ